MMDNMKEKLVELLCKIISPTITIEEQADFLIAHSVTVQDGKLLEAFLHPIDDYKGLKAKYLVFKADTGEMIDNCFVLRPDKDSAAVEALRAYADATDNETLAEDIYNWVGKDEQMQEWISVKDRLPKQQPGYDRWWGYVALKFPNGSVDIDVAIYKFANQQWYTVDGMFDKMDYVTHWMPRPQPPKGE